MAFLWVGVNDVVGDAPWTFRAVNTLLGIRASKDVDEFRACYQAALELLRCRAHTVIAVSAALKGEDVSNAWNRELAVLSGEIEALAAQYEQVEYLDVRAIFAQNLAGKSVSNYLPNSVVRVALDALTLRTNERIDRKAAARGLRLTLDGLHLNSAGAALVAEAFEGVIACKR